jgi:tRNA threonylcarbamoyladenosine modification (KEOPS) complex  Pcc1 subunit
MNPGRYNLTVYKGTTFQLKPVWKIGGVPVNLSGYTADMQVRYATDSSIIVELSTSNGRITIDSADGRVNLYISATDTAALPAGTYQYDLNLTNTADSTVYKILQGTFIIAASVTH